jgi:hypothetical protein
MSDKMNEAAAAGHDADATVTFGAASLEKAEAHGRFDVECIGPDGEVKWRESMDNVVTTVGKNLALDTFLAGAAYTVVGPYIGLISSVSWSAVNATDTMTSHAGWTEAGVTNAPTYTVPRKTAAWSAAAAGAKALSSALGFAITGSGTIKGCFVVFGTGALSTVDNTAGTLYSAGTFAADKVVNANDTVNVTYTASL